MIDITIYAKEIESGLNNLISKNELLNGYIFSVVPDIRQFKRAERTGNNVLSYINCLLTSEPSANGTSNGLELLVENFNLQIIVPTEKIRSSLEDVPESVTANGVFVFVESIKAIVNDYFKINKIESYTDASSGKTYEAGMGYTISRTGDSGNLPIIGEYVPFYVYININLVQNGINSKDVTLEMDGEAVPFQVLTPNRAGEKSIAVYSDNTAAAKTITTSSTIAFDVALPATTGTVTQQFNKYLLNGTPNLIHFIRFQFGKDSSMSKYYLMGYGDVSTQIQGVKNAGLTLPLVEVGFEPDLFNLPEYMQIYKIALSFPHSSVSFNVANVNSENAIACIVATGAENIKKYAGKTMGVVHTFDESEVIYDDETDKYYGYIIACPVDKKNAGIPLITNISV